MVELEHNIDNFAFQASGTQQGALKDFRGKWLILYFYPKDNTPGCTTESQDFRDNIEAFKKLNAEVLGISRDSLKSHENFIAKQQLPFALISDTNESICQLFDVIKMKNNFGRQVQGIERSTFILCPEGKLRHVWRKVKVKGHVQEVLNTLTELA